LFLNFALQTLCPPPYTCILSVIHWPKNRKQNR